MLRPLTAKAAATLRVVSCIAIFLAVGCATPPVEEGPSPEKVMAAEILANVRQSCEKSFEAFKAGKSQAYCTFSPTDLHFSFKSEAVYAGHAVAISQMVQAFCVASQMTSGEWQKYSWTFEQERTSYSRRCRDPRSLENPTEKQ